MLQALKGRSGFTLAEIILVMALTVFLMTITVQGFVNSSAQFKFGNEADKIQELIRRARSLAISGKAQLDYTDYNKNTCTDNPATTKPGVCTAPEYVTPAHYGVQFFKYGDLNTVSLFVDNHSPKAGQEGYYESGPVDQGYDYILDYFILPPGMQLIIPDAHGSTSPGNGNEASIFFSPIFADVSSDITIDPKDPFFRFGIVQKQGNIVRKKCSQIQMLAGISEPMAIPDGGPSAQDYCP